MFLFYWFYFFSLLLVSCANSENRVELKQLTSINSMFKIKDDYETSKISKISSIEGEYEDCTDNMIFTSSTVNSVEKISAYNANNGSLIGSYDSSTIEIDVNEYDIFYVLIDDVYSIYNIEGNVIDTIPSSDMQTTSYVNDNTFSIGDRYYSSDDSGKVSKLDSSFSSSLDYDYIYKKYKYFIDSDTIIIAKDGKKPVSYTVPSYASYATFEILSNGNAIVQYEFPVTESDDYVYFDPSTDLYYNMVTLRITPAGNIKEIKFSYRINAIASEIVYEDLWEEYGFKAQNIISGTVIENKMLAQSFVAAMSNTLKVGTSFSNGSSYISIVSPKRAIVHIDNFDYLYNQNGRFLSELNNYTYTTTKYFRSSGKIYNWDLDEVANASDYTFASKIGENYLYYKMSGENKEMYIFNGSFVKLCDNCSTYYSYNTYNILEISQGLDYEYYDENGTKLLQTTLKLYFGPSLDESIIAYTINESGTYEYYRITYKNPSIFMPA